MKYLTDGFEACTEGISYKVGQKERKNRKEKKIRGPATLEARR